MHFIHRSKLKEYQFLFNFFIVDRRLWEGQQSGLKKEKEGTVLRPHFELLKQGELKARCLISKAQTELTSIKEGETALKREAV